jgi:protocatechuate 3,4-dioxygenase beta subunit
MKTTLMVLLAVVAALPITARQQRLVRTIEGIVVRAEDGTPVPGARVILDHPPVTRSGGWADKERNDRTRLATAETVIADPGGRFFLTGVIADWPTYTVLLVRANGFVPQNLSLGANDPKPGERLTIKLERAGAISGLVKDPSGRPIPHMPVRLIQQEYESYGVGVPLVVDRAHTNDRGEYRIYGIEPGRYRLLAGNGLPAYLGGNASGPRGPLENIDAFGYSYYPGVLAVRSGTDLNGVNFTMAPRPLHRIRGRIIDSRTGQAPARPSISVFEANTLTGNEATMTDMTVARLGAGSIYDPSGGHLDIRSLAPGAYTITVRAVDPSPRPAPADFEPVRSSGSATVTVSTADVEDVTIVLWPHGSIRGRFLLEGGGRETIRLDGFSVTLKPLRPSDPKEFQDEPGSNYAEADGSFTIHNIPRGTYRVAVDNGFRQDAYVRAVRYNGVDLPGAALNYSGAEFAPLEVTLSPAAGEVSGNCVDIFGKPAVSAGVALIPDRNRDNADLFKWDRTEADGHFRFRGIAPGSYRVFCSENTGWNSWFDPGFVAERESKGHPVLLTERGRETILVQVIPR